MARDRKRAGSGGPPSNGPWRPGRDVVAKRLEDETVLVHLRTNRVYALNRTASKLWELIEAGCDRARIQERMRAEFDVEDGQLEDELQELLALLADERLLAEEDA